MLYQIQATVGVNATLVGDERETGNLNKKVKINDKTKQKQLTRAVQKDGSEWRNGFKLKFKLTVTYAYNTTVTVTVRNVVES